MFSLVPLERGRNVFKTKFKSSCTQDPTLEKYSLHNLYGHFHITSLLISVVQNPYIIL